MIRAAQRSTSVSPKRVRKRRNRKRPRFPQRDWLTRDAATDPVVPWPDHLIVVEPASIIAASERLERKGGREAMGRCPTEQDAEAAAEWLIDRMSRLSPGLQVSSLITSAGGQFLVSLTT